MMFDSLLDWFNFIAFDQTFDIFDDYLIQLPSKVQKNLVSGLRILVLFQNHSAIFLRYTSKDSARNSPEKSETLIILTLN